MNSTHSGIVRTFFGALLLGALPFAAFAQPDLSWPIHDRTRPQPLVITPGTSSSQDEPGKPPSDAVILFDGKEIGQWVAMDGNPTKWIVTNGYMQCVAGSGWVRTLQNFGDCQLHVEWAAPLSVKGQGQGRGNSGVFFGLDRYEIQVLDSYENPTYADGGAGALYGQFPPLVNACRPPGQWQTYDVIYTAPRFNAEGKLLSPTRFTVFHNGVLIQNDIQLSGPTTWLERPAYAPHPEKQPIALQDHGNPVRFRNIWVRELGKPGKKEFTLPESSLQKNAGVYDTGWIKIDVALEKGQLVARIPGPAATFNSDPVKNPTSFILFAEAPTKFFSKSGDLQMEFQADDSGRVTGVVWSMGEGARKAKKIK